MDILLFISPLYRSRPFRQVAEQAVLLSPQARTVLAVSRRGDPVPATWFEVADLLRMRKNSSLFTVLAHRFRRIGQICTDDRAIREIAVTYADWKGNHRSLKRSIVIALAGVCLGKMAKGSFRTSMMSAARDYTEEVLLMEDMAEVVDESCVQILEGQFLHGSS
jgi:hypothetical protein